MTCGVPFLNLAKLRLLVILPLPLLGEKMWQEQWWWFARALDPAPEPCGTNGGRYSRSWDLGGPSCQSQGKYRTSLIPSQKLARDWLAPCHSHLVYIPNHCSASDQVAFSVSIHVPCAVNINCRWTFWFHYLFGQRLSLWSKQKESPHLRPPDLAKWKY